MAMKWFLYGDLLRRADHAHQTVHVTAPATNLYMVQQHLLDRKVPLYHVALLGEDRRTGAKRLFEHGPIRTNHCMLDQCELENAVLAPLPPVAYTIDDIRDFESTLPTRYILGVRDCRHHVRDLMAWCYASASDPER